jgi:hypothetical protein
MLGAGGEAVTLFNRLQTWWQVQTGEEDTPFDGDSSAFVVSLLFHMVLLLALGLIPYILPDNQVTLTITAPVEDLLIEDLKLPTDFAFSEQPSVDVGANSVGDVEMAMSLAQVVSDVSDIPSPMEMEPVIDAKIEINQEIQVATGLHFSENLSVKGAAGEGVTGAEGAIDRLTFEILRSMEERKTLVVWLFDQSASLNRQRRSIYERFDRIYEELGVIESSGDPAFAKRDDKPLLTSVIAFGQGIHLMTKEPTDDLPTIKAAVEAIQQDDSGIERIFSTIHMAVDRYKQFRTRSPVTNQADRNVMIVAFTDERGDDLDGLEPTISLCRRYAVPVYAVGVPAPFGREETLVKWVDPDPQYDQTAQWGEVNQGPESLFPERLKLVTGSLADELDPMDSGFGPFALTRLCYETGGIFFSVHPNRNVNREVSRGEIDAFSAYLKHFFDPHVMRPYRPDYVSADEYLRRAQANQTRAALLTAARKSWVSSMGKPQLRFVRRSEAELSNSLSEAQKGAAKAEPLLNELYETLRVGEADRPRETAPRWQAGYDLAMGQVMATMVRTQAYNAMLAQAKRGMPFANANNNTWVLAPSSEVTIDSRLGKAAEKAVEYLQRVIDEHPDTPWALLARHELDTPIGWMWTEEFTDLTPRGSGGGGGGDGGGNDMRRTIERGPAKRPVPKL